MSTINRLSSVDALQPGDLIPVWDGSNGDTRKASLTTLLAFIESNFADPDYSTRIVAPAVDYFNVDIGATGDSIWMIINPTLNFTNGAVTLPPASSAVNDQEITMVFTASVSTFVITSAGATVIGTPVQINGYDSFRVRYNASQQTWYNIGTTGSGSGSGVSQIVRQDFTGDGTTTTFALLNIPSALGNELQIFIDGVYQERAGYTVSGVNIIFSEAPPVLSNIEVLGWSVSIGAETSANLVSYTPAGTGAVLTTVQAKLRESVSVKDFGAVGDGVTDDTAAIQAALNASLNVHFPVGTYKSTAGVTGLVPQSGSRITMDDGAEIRLGANGYGFHITGSNVELHNVTVNGMSATYTSASYAAIYVDWIAAAGANVTITNCKLYDHGGGGVIALASSGQASSGLVVRGCTVTSTGTHGIIAQDYISDVEITGNVVKYSGLNFADRPGITASRYGSNVIVSNNTVVGSASALGTSVHGISIDGTTNATCAGNVVSNTIGYGIEIGGVTNGTFTGNTVTNSTRASIALSGLNGVLRNTNVTVSGNACYTNNDSGILAFITSGVEAYMHKNITISGNTITGTVASAGIYTTLIDGLCISNNMVTDCYLGGLLIQDCKDTMITGNIITRNNVVDIKNAAITLSGSTATVTSAAHGYSNGAIVTIFGANPSEYSGAFTISNVTTDTFDYTTIAGLLTPAVGTIQCSLANNTSYGGVKIVYSLITSKPRVVFGENIIERNGYRQVYDIGLEGCVGFVNDVLYLKEAPLPRASTMSSGEAPNIQDRIGLMTKNDKVVFAYANAGVIKYLTIAADGATTAWLNSGTQP